jgi:hypothetical protein
MDTFLEIALVGVWIVIATVALTRAYGSPGPPRDWKRKRGSVA